MMSNSLGKYYQKQRKVTKRARESYQNLSEKKKEKKSVNMVSKNSLT